MVWTPFVSITRLFTLEIEDHIISEVLVLGLCILLLDEVDALCPRRDSSCGSSHSVRATVQLLSLLEKADATPGLIVIATTNKPNSLDPSVRRPGRLETEVRSLLNNYYY